MSLVRGEDEVKVGDLVKFKATGEHTLYLGLIDEMYTFYHAKFGIVELWEQRFDISEVEAVK
jgi:hypothetical protein